MAQPRLAGAALCDHLHWVRASPVRHEDLEPATSAGMTAVIRFIGTRAQVLRTRDGARCLPLGNIAIDRLAAARSESAA